MLVELLASLLGECGRRLVHDNNLRIEVCRFYDLYQLAVLKVIIINDVGCLDPVKSVFLK